MASWKACAYVRDNRKSVAFLQIKVEIKLQMVRRWSLMNRWRVQTVDIKDIDKQHDGAPWNRNYVNPAKLPLRMAKCRLFRGFSDNFDKSSLPHIYYFVSEPQKAQYQNLRRSKKQNKYSWSTDHKNKKNDRPPEMNDYCPNAWTPSLNCKILYIVSFINGRRFESRHRPFFACHCVPRVLRPKMKLIYFMLCTYEWDKIFFLKRASSNRRIYTVVELDEWSIGNYWDEAHNALMYFQDEIQ